MTATVGEVEAASVSWFKAASIRGAKTAIMVAVPYLGAVVAFGSVNWWTVIGAVVLAFLLSLLTSAITGLPEVAGKVLPVWVAVLERVAKTFAQAVVAGVGSTVIFGDVSWSVVLNAAGIAALGSLITNIASNLPETPVTATGTGRADDPYVVTALQPVVPTVDAPAQIVEASTAMIRENVAHRGKSPAKKPAAK